MSDITTFFPAAGGSDITDPKLLPRIAVGPITSSRLIKSGSTTLTGDNDMVFWNIFNSASLAESFSRIELSATYNTYETLVDVSSSTNGGYLNYILGSYINAGHTETYKITVDGVATEIVRSVPTGGGYQASILGWVSPGKGSTSGPNGNAGPGAMGEQSAFQSTIAVGTPTVLYNNISNGFRYGYQDAYTLPNAPWAYPNLKFKETLKVEIKRSDRYTSSPIYNYAGVRLTMI
jgi:hypothetical protein